MSKQTKIDWTDQTWNVFIGCTPVSAACEHCYAAREEDGRFRRLGRCIPQHGLRYAAAMARVTLHGKYFFRGPVRQGEDKIFDPLSWSGNRMVFVCPRSDLFHESIPFEQIDQVFAIMAMRQDLTFQVLTKRSARRLEYMKLRAVNAGVNAGWYQTCTDWLDQGVHGPLGRHWDRCHESLEQIDLAKPLPNVWQLTTIWDQASADAEIPLLLQTPAAIRGVSIEPILGPVKLKYDRGDWCFDYFNGTKFVQDCDSTDADNWGKLDWVIAGGESGPGARPAHPDWFRELRYECGVAGVPFFFKQWGRWRLQDGMGFDQGGVVVMPAGNVFQCDDNPDHKIRALLESDGALMRPSTKKQAGHVLDGREHREFPWTKHLPNRRSTK